MMKFFIPIGIALLVGLCAALEKEQVVAKVQPNVIKHVGNFEPLKASVEPAYLDDYLVSLKDDVDASKLRELVAHLKKMNADEKAPNFQAHVEEDDIHEEFNMFTVKKVMYYSDFCPIDDVADSFDYYLFKLLIFKTHSHLLKLLRC